LSWRVQIRQKSSPIRNEQTDAALSGLTASFGAGLEVICSPPLSKVS
jgi:hypothetical protein